VLKMPFYSYQSIVSPGLNKQSRHSGLRLKLSKALPNEFLHCKCRPTLTSLICVVFGIANQLLLLLTNTPTQLILANHMVLYTFRPRRNQKNHVLGCNGRVDLLLKTETTAPAKTTGIFQSGE